MTEAEWLACADPQRMLDAITRDHPDGVRHPLGRLVPTDRKLRLFSCAMWRRRPEVMDSLNAWGLLEASEKLADDLLPAHELAAVRADWPIDLDGAGLPYGSWVRQASLHLHTVLTPAERQPEERAAQAGLLRDVFGNPWRPVRWQEYQPDSTEGGLMLPCWTDEAYRIRQWNGGTVVSIARAIYDDRRFEDMPVLADALEEVGCTDEAILAHCRQPGEHVRGCWVIDLILGKE